ncbi:MAG TPA: hypothetical protein VGR67_05990 [Candidatus Polarisedimenticolia bacterium]|nr:hypothetical protein [Candidatus Polarisedimenticolia bacterium]
MARWVPQEAWKNSNTGASSGMVSSIASPAAFRPAGGQQSAAHRILISEGPKSKRVLVPEKAS